MIYSETPDIDEWQLAEVIVDSRAMFILWAIKTLFCTRREDFLINYDFSTETQASEEALDELLKRLLVQNFLQQDGADYVLTEMGKIAVEELGETEISEYADLLRETKDVQERFAIPTEASHVEERLIQQLRGLGWDYIEGDSQVPYLSERETFNEVLLKKRLEEAIYRINQKRGERRWIGEKQINQIIYELEQPQAQSLMECNKDVTKRILQKGVLVAGDPVLHGGNEQEIRVIDFENPRNNDFVAINQFRVNLADGQRYIVPDMVLFVNGIPLAVIECKNPASTNPVEAGITQLLRYSNQLEGNEGVEKLFYSNQLLVATCFYEARVGTIGGVYEHFQEWKDTSPTPKEVVAERLGVKQLSSQQLLVAGMLDRGNLLDLLRNFILYQETGGKTVKMIARYQQFRAVHKAMERLLTGATKKQDGESDRRGGVIWHTQGSGKSLTMAFLVRKMRRDKDLRSFKIVMVTDRTELEEQLEETMQLIEQPSRKATDIEDLKSMLREPGADLVFGMIQKYQELDRQYEQEQAGRPGKRVKRLKFPVLNRSEKILVIVDEAHRSQSHTLHANLMEGLPFCAKIGFTGTPIILEDRKKTMEIFGDYIDRYTIKQSEIDGATVPILYEDRKIDIEITDEEKLNAQYEEIMRDQPKQVREQVQRRYVTRQHLHEFPGGIAAKAEDMLLHYAATILPNEMKAMVVTGSRQAAVDYCQQLQRAKERISDKLRQLDPALRQLSEQEQEKLAREERLLVQAAPYVGLFEQIQFAAVISADNRDPEDWKQWSSESARREHRERFKKPLLHTDPQKRDPLAFLCVNNMLITGFDAPVAQVLYLDRKMEGHELLQAIARVNRLYREKHNGLIVDYYGVAKSLKLALIAYSAEEVQGALMSIRDEYPKLQDRHRRVRAVFQERGINEIETSEGIDECINLLEDAKIRADFEIKLKKFLESLDIVLPRPEALEYVHEARLFGFINHAAANRYRDQELNLVGTGRKVQQLIYRHLIVQGIRPTIEPISILDSDFEKKVSELPSEQSQASEMKHALRYHIDVHEEEDPAYYEQISERLKRILQEVEEEQISQREGIEALQRIAREIKERESRAVDEHGLNMQREVPFFNLLAKEVSQYRQMRVGEEAEEGSGWHLTPGQSAQLVTLTRSIVEHISREIQIFQFWRKPDEQIALSGWITQTIDHSKILPLPQAQKLGRQMLQLAKRRHQRLVA